MNREELARGTIARIEDHGTIVTIVLNTEDGRHPVNFDHRMAQVLLDSAPRAQLREVTWVHGYEGDTEVLVHEEVWDDRQDADKEVR